MIYGTSTNSFPDDAYGVDTDNPETWRDYFWPNEKVLREIRNNYIEITIDFLADVAEKYHIDTDGWEWSEYLEFKERLEL